MSEKASIFLQLLLVMGLGALLYGIADPFGRFISGLSAGWERDGVIRGPAMKIWKEESPRRFSAVTGLYISMAIVWRAMLKGIGVVMIVLAFVALIATGVRP